MHSQLLARGRHDILIVGQVWVPLNVGNIPSASLREESIHSVGRRPALSSSTTYRGGWKGASKSMMNKPFVEEAAGAGHLKPLCLGAMCLQDLCGIRFLSMFFFTKM